MVVLLVSGISMCHFAEAMATAFESSEISD
jgi:hypothetical protein